MDFGEITLPFDYEYFSPYNYVYWYFYSDRDLDDQNNQDIVPGSIPDFSSFIIPTTNNMVTCPAIRITGSINGEPQYGSPDVYSLHSSYFCFSWIPLFIFLFLSFFVSICTRFICNIIKNIRGV